MKNNWMDFNSYYLCIWVCIFYAAILRDRASG